MSTLTIVIDVPATALIPNIIKIMQDKDSAIACPAIMFANNRIIRAKGLVKILKNSMNGIRGIGTFNHIGTSGQNISFQYAFVPVKFVIKNVHKAKKNVMVIFPVKFPPPGGKGTTPIIFAKNIKKSMSKDMVHTYQFPCPMLL